MGEGVGHHRPIIPSNGNRTGWVAEMVDPHISNKDVVGGGCRKWSISSSWVSAAGVYIIIVCPIVISGGARPGRARSNDAVADGLSK